MGLEKYPVRLAQGEREQLQQVIRGGKSPARKTARTRILLKTDEGWSAPKVAEALDISVGTVFRIKRRFAEGGLEGDGPGPSEQGSWMIRERPTSSPWLAVRRQKGTTTGPCAYWPRRWWSWGGRPPCPMRVSANVSKKRSQAVAEEGVVYS